MSSDSDNFLGIHHSSFIVSNTKKSLAFYVDVLGMSQVERVELPFDGAWLAVGDQQIHLLELPDPCECSDLPEHGGRDRHAALLVLTLDNIKRALEKASINYTLSRSGRPALFVRDPDGNALELIECQA